MPIINSTLNVTALKEISFLDNLPEDVHLTGSRRFGRDNILSDYDFVIIAEGDDMSSFNNLCRKFSYRGYRRVSESTEYHITGEMAVYRNPTANIDVIIVTENVGDAILKTTNLLIGAFVAAELVVPSKEEFKKLFGCLRDMFLMRTR
jgi:hypothetical protein